MGSEEDGGLPPGPQITDQIMHEIRRGVADLNLNPGFISGPELRLIHGLIEEGLTPQDLARVIARRRQNAWKETLRKAKEDLMKRGGRLS